MWVFTPKETIFQAEMGNGIKSQAVEALRRKGEIWKML